MEKTDFVIGIDFGTDSVRAVVVNAANGQEEAAAVCDYPAGSKGSIPTRRRTNSATTRWIILKAWKRRLKKHWRNYPRRRELVAGIGVDTTGSTPCAVDRAGRPLALQEEFATNPNAMFVLWKDHTAVRETEEINHHARNWGGRDFTCYEGGIYSSEWFWAKIMHVYRQDPQVQKAAYSWLELCDWIPALLTGVEDVHAIKRSRCAAGHKAMWHRIGAACRMKSSWSAGPVAPGFTGPAVPGDIHHGPESRRAQPGVGQRLGLRPGIAVAVGGFDAHMGAVGGGSPGQPWSRLWGLPPVTSWPPGRGRQEAD